LVAACGYTATEKGVRIVLNNVTGNVKSDEWYTPVEIVQKCYELLNPRYKSVIMCPYDTQDSHFVKVGQMRNHTVIHSITDYLETDYEYEYVITNPPFSIKDDVIERVLESARPAALILPVDSLGGKRRHALFKKYSYPSIYVPTKRINYVDGSGLNRQSSSFHSIIMLLNVNHSNLLWEQ
jgi:16S rRNA A1518/A1519 N6-dimethyltransferase RsmA/KsgA/DIM1 with predicted DNA glycosylase/AP lyase activity